MEFGDASAVDDALDVLHVSLDHLIKLVEDRGLEILDDTQLVSFLQGFERLRNRLPLVDHQVINEAGRRGLPESLCQGSLPRMLASALRISIPEAARRVRAAQALSERMSLAGQPLDTIRPHLAEAQRSGEIGPEQVDIITRALAAVDQPGSTQPTSTPENNCSPGSPSTSDPKSCAVSLSRSWTRSTPTAASRKRS
jgi:Domain of unknown function (DUF222)